MHINNFSSYSSFKKKYLTLDRAPFFELALECIDNSTRTILDIGSGEGDFLLYLKEKGVNPDKVYLLDGNQATVEANKKLTPNSVFYMAPDRLPFEDLSVDVVHTSHLVDNLGPADFYNFLLELNRVLKPGGYLVVSTPVLWPDFYNDLSHTKPYNPYVFYKYFVQQGRHSRFEKVKHDYAVQKLIYRYYEMPLDEGWGSTVPFLDAIFITSRRILRKFGIKRLRKNGYTLILKKGDGQAI